MKIDNKCLIKIENLLEKMKIKKFYNKILIH